MFSKELLELKHIILQRSSFLDHFSKRYKQYHSLKFCKFQSPNCTTDLFLSLKHTHTHTHTHTYAHCHSLTKKPTPHLISRTKSCISFVFVIFLFSRIIKSFDRKCANKKFVLCNSYNQNAVFYCN